jgi:condensin complex subunit 1
MSDFNLQEELLSLSSDPSIYHIPAELEVPSLSESSLDAHLSSAIESVINDPDALTHSSTITFDVFRSILKHADSASVGPSILVKTLDVITSGLTHHTNAVLTLTQPGADEDADAPMVHRSALEMWAFLLQWFITIGERGVGRPTDAVPRATKGKAAKKKAGPSGGATVFVWEDVLPGVLTTMHRALRLPTGRIWRTTSEREAFVGCFVKPAYQLCESEQHLKSNEIRLGVYKTICLAVKFHGHAFGAQTSIAQNLTYFEHLSEPMAELLAILEKEFDYPQLAEEVLRDVAGKSFAHNDAKGPRSFSKFLVRLAELSPRVVQKQMPLLLAHLDCEVRAVP